MLAALKAILPAFIEALKSLGARELVAAVLWLATIAVIAVILSGCGQYTPVERTTVTIENQLPETTNVQAPQNEP